MKLKSFSFGCLLLIYTLYPCLSVAEPTADRENSIKAAYLYNLLKFIQWPDQRIQRNNSIEVCTFSGVAINSQLNAITLRKAKGRRISIRIISPDDTIPSSCFLLFISSINNKLNSVIKLNNQDNSAILTVGESEEFLKTKGHVALVHKKDHVQLQINIRRIKQNKFNVNGKLLEIAKIINY